MGKFIESKQKGICLQTKKTIKVGDSVFYFPGRGMFCIDSQIYQEHLKNGAYSENNESETREDIADIFVE